MSECPECGALIQLGELVEWAPGQKAAHVRCPTDVEGDVPPLPEIQISCPPNRAFLAYQVEGIRFVAARFARGYKGALIADEMGLGKTIQAIGALNTVTAIKTCLIVCPAGLKLNWRAELDKWLVRTDLEVNIINYDILKKVPADRQYDLLVLDEGHRIKNPKAQRTKHIMALKARCKHILALTGTPILNRPLELWTTLQILDPQVWDPPGRVKGVQVGEGQGAGFFQYAKRYCNAHPETIYVRGGHGEKKTVWNFDGHSNENELGNRLRSSIMIRRLKADVLKDLPAKRYQVISLPSARKEPWMFDGRAAKFRGENFDELILNAKREIPFEELSKTRHEEALAKIPACVDHIEDVLESIDKVILFAHHQDVIQKLSELLQSHGVKQITGDTPMKDRDEAVLSFQNDPETHLIIGSIGAMGVGLTLTASSHVIFVELDWVPACMQQAEDRCHRIGQLESVLVQHLVISGSLDERITEILVAKQRVANDILRRNP
jgi:SWI/SNF-related matrix-associated actin-dependent regulator 1 of chromatin subfamily A